MNEDFRQVLASIPIWAQFLIVAAGLLIAAFCGAYPAARKVSGKARDVILGRLDRLGESVVEQVRERILKIEKEFGMDDPSTPSVSARLSAIQVDSHIIAAKLERQGRAISRLDGRMTTVEKAIFPSVTAKGKK